MKKHVVILSLLPLLLTSCGGSSKNPTKLPNKGTEVTKEVGEARFLNAYDATVTLGDAIGMKVEGAKLALKVKADIVSSGAHLKGNMETHIDDFALHAGVQGLTGDNVSDLKGSAKLSTKYSAKTDIIEASAAEPDVNVETKKEFKKKKLAVGAYVEDNWGYLDLSDGNTQKAMEEFNAAASNADVTSEVSYHLPSRMKQALGMEDEDFPLLASLPTTLTDEVQDGTKEDPVGGMAPLLPEGTYRDHGDGTYSYSFSLNGGAMAENLDTAADAVAAEAEAHKKGSFASSLNFAALGLDKNDTLSFAAIYDEEHGIQSFGIDIDMDAHVDLGQFYARETEEDSEKLEKDDQGLSGTVDLSLVFKFKVEFSYGEGVNIDTVKNPEDYKDVEGLIQL